MVTEHFQLKRLPFTAEIDPAFMLKFASFNQGDLRLQAALQQRGMALVVGESGAGKSTLIRCIEQRLARSSYRLLYAPVPVLNHPVKAVMDDLLAQLGEPVPFRNPSKGIKLLQSSLRSLEQQGTLPIVVLDDVHAFDQPSWLLLKTLTNYDIDSKLPFCLWLLGDRQEITTTLTLNRMAEIRGRMHFCYHLRGLEPGEVEAYLKTHLAWAGCDRPLFPREAALEIHRHTKGLPRQVNRLAYGALVAAACARKDLVDMLCIEQAASELIIPAQRAS